MAPGFLPPILSDVFTTVVFPLIYVIYSLTKDKITMMESRVEKANEALTIFSATIAAAQSKSAYLEKQLDAIFELLRDIRDELKQKADKAH